MHVSVVILQIRLNTLWKEHPFRPRLVGSIFVQNSRNFGIREKYRSISATVLGWAFSFRIDAPKLRVLAHLPRESSRTSGGPFYFPPFCCAPKKTAHADLRPGNDTPNQARPQRTRFVSEQVLHQKHTLEQKGKESSRSVSVQNKAGAWYTRQADAILAVNYKCQQQFRYYTPPVPQQ